MARERYVPDFVKNSPPGTYYQYTAEEDPSMTDKEFWDKAFFLFVANPNTTVIEATEMACEALDIRRDTWDDEDEDE